MFLFDALSFLWNINFAARNALSLWQRNASIMSYKEMDKMIKVDILELRGTFKIGLVMAREIELSYPI